ncbi:MAG: hypothetical protein JW814_11805 [Candidatus Krumholzibacteriota bacterium]|nr:hypothetical protein [Candidatus Krumholzibacteriota bacterium]
MKHVLIIFGILLIVISCYDEISTTILNQPNLIYEIEVETDRWRSYVEPFHTFSYDTFIVQEGESFGPELDPGEYRFTLYAALSADSVLITFDEGLVVVGEAIAQPSSHRYVGLSELEACLRTRSYDSGSDYCIRILK